MSNLDERLLSGEMQAAAAGELRERKQPGSAEAMAGESGEPNSFRERLMAAKRALDIKQQAKDKLEAAVMAPAKRGTDWLLRASWINLIWSFGLTLIWINIHVFLYFVLGDKLFCKLGQEWLDWLTKNFFGFSTDKLKAGGAGMGLHYIEVMVLLILDLIVLCVMGAALVIIVMIIDFMQAGVWEQLKAIVGGLTGLGWSGITALYDLFAL